MTVDSSGSRTTGGPASATEPTARFFERLVELDESAVAEPLLDELLELLVGITGAELVYVEARVSDEVVLRRGFPGDNLDLLRRSISRGIMRSAVSECRTISTAGALADDRFANLASVYDGQIQSVVCAPIKVQGYVGALYIQGDTEFRAEHRELVEGLARRLGRRLAWPLDPSSTITMERATEAFRRWFALEALERNGWKGTATATALGISRSTLYELVGDMRARRRLGSG